MASHVPRLPVQLVVELINEWATTPQEVSPRAWHGYPGADAKPRLELMELWPSELPEPNDHSIAEACDRVYPVFTVQWPYATAQHLNQAIADSSLSPHLEAEGDALSLEWSTDGTVQLMTGVLVASLLDHISQAPRDRFGICESSTCADVLVDQSPTHTKHFCSPRCQTRERVRAYRSRGVVN